MKRALAIINPISGTGSKRSVPELLGRAYQDTPFELFFTYTREAGHAEELARRAAAEGYDHVIAVGGDGTVNEVARGLLHSSTALGIIPKGSGNGLARTLGIPMNAEQAIAALVGAQRASIDACQVGDRPFFCTCGMGFDAAVSWSFAEADKRGPMTYLQTMVSEYRSFSPDSYRVTLDDAEPFETEAFVLVLANASQYGNNAYIAPAADLSDGLIDLAIIRPFPVLEAAVVLGDLMLGRLEGNKHYETLRARRVRIERGAVGPVHLDGEPFELGATLEVEVLPLALQVLLPPQS